MTAVIILMLWGGLTYTTIPRREDPEFTVRACQILTSWPGTSTEQVEQLVTAPIEAEVNTLDGIRWVKSETSVGRSSIIVELDRDTPSEDVEQMWDKVRSRVDRVALPSASIRPLVIDDFGDTNVMVLALYQVPLFESTVVEEQNRYTPRQLDIYSQRLLDELKLVPGVAKVERVGIQNEAIYIETDIGNWTQLSLTSSQLEDLVSIRNVIAPGGEVDTKVGRFSITPSGNIDAVQELDSIIAGKTGSESSQVPVYLSDLGLQVRRDYQDPPQTITRYGNPDNSSPCVLVQFSMKAGANIVTVCDDARAMIRRLTEEDKILPSDLTIDAISDQSLTVTRKIDEFVWNVVGAIAIIIVVVFLMVGLRSASVMAANIPLVIIGSIALMPLCDVQMEQISLAAMIIALGMLVDNAVQICDQSRRLQSEGLSPSRAAVQGATQLAFPILIATGTTIAAFYPMLFGLKGGSKEYVRSLPITITITLSLSYVLAMTFCVLLAGWFIRLPADPDAPSSPIFLLWYKLRKKSKRKRSGKGGFISSLYPRISRACLKARFLVLLVSFGSLFLVLQLPIGSQFFPQDIRDQFAVEVWLPEGVGIAQTDRATQEVEDIIRRLSPYTDDEGRSGQRLKNMRSVVGQGGGRWYLGRNPEPPKPNYAEILVQSTDGLLTDQYVRDIRRVASGGDEDLGLSPVVQARVIPRQLVMGPAVEAPIGIRVFGPSLGSSFADPTIMRGLAAKLRDMLQDLHGTWDVYDTWGSSAYRVDVQVDEDKANLAGTSNFSIAQTLNAFFNGHRITTFREGNNQIPVYLRLPSDQRGSLELLESAYVEGLSGKVPLSSVAKVLPEWDAAKMERRFLQRVIEVRARVEQGFLANDIVTKLLASPEYMNWEKNLPPGYRTEVGGELFESELSKKDISFSFLISILAIVLLLIIQYNGVAKPIIILTTLPLALIGAFLGLYVTGNPLGFMPQLGLLSLFGIVVNTAIIFIEFADLLILEKVKKSNGSGPILGLTVTEFRECLVSAGEARLLPIAMTTLTTIGGLLPLALAGGPLWEGMAWLMIFGLTVATLLTLIVVPALYAIFVENLKVKPVRIPVSREESPVKGQ